MSNQVTTVRLPRETRNKLIALSRAKGKTKTEIVKESLEMYYAHDESEREGLDSYTLGLPYFGKYSSGESDLSATYKQRIKEKIRAKYSSN